MDSLLMEPIMPLAYPHPYCLTKASWESMAVLSSMRRGESRSVCCLLFLSGLDQVLPSARSGALTFLRQVYTCETIMTNVSCHGHHPISFKYSKQRATL